MAAAVSRERRAKSHLRAVFDPPSVGITSGMNVEEFFAGIPVGVKVYKRVSALLEKSGHPFTTRIGKSQIAFRRKKGFAHLWRPGQYLSNAKADVVLSIALGHHVKSPRFKEVAHPARAVWMHHLEVHDVKDLDDEVAGWLREAADKAG